MAFRYAANDELPLLRARVGDIPHRMLVVGDPARARSIAERLDSVVELGHNREYVVVAGRWRGAPVGVASHGVGAAGAAVCFEELARAGVTRMIRAGTCGALRPGIADGELVLATAAIRDEGLTVRLVDPVFPAVADIDLVLALRRAGAAAGLAVHEGIVLTSDLFYPHEVLGGNLDVWARAGAVAVEMEASALFVTSSLHGVAAAAVFVVDGAPLADPDMSGYDPHRTVVRDAVDAMAGVALDALVAEA